MSRLVETSVKPPIVLLGVSFALSLIGIGTALAIGGSLAGYFFGIVATLSAFGCLFINRTRQMNPNYDFSKPWFRSGIAAAYWLSVGATLLHIVRYAIAYANS